MASKNDEDIIDGICEKGRLIRLAEKYILNCLESERKKPRLPNVCGFFRWLKLGPSHSTDSDVCTPKNIGRCL